ncbi:cephalosporin-C deacetylase [Deinobacterium chartae]|uniref:Cephalosporin-C deacetylase n=1 Tax=Deinobacterium chartae TaxID=521158 RepID=A0A841HWX0_9DEIO|nr:acetylxylan esterase [Deinobacterium chartae]MBB6097416.1 cephalosporin-C deacetylase [Deinobacterium chartae]
MAFLDLPLEQLRDYVPELTPPNDLDRFWQQTLEAARTHDLAATFTPVPHYGFATVEVFDVAFAGYGGQTVRGWLLLPKQRSAPLPCVVQYIGYGGGRGLPHEWLQWSALGYANLIMDTRGQGSAWRSGDTPDLEVDGANPQLPGFMTRGVLSPQTYYYRRLYTDAVRALEAARVHPAVDPSRVVVAGGSQGGGLALAAAALGGGVAAVMPEVPFLCHFPRAITLTDSLPYSEIAAFLRVHRDREEQVLQTLSYFDLVHLAPRITAPALFSVGLMDPVCPPSTVFAAYNRLSGPREIRVYRYNAHEGGGVHHLLEQARFLRELWD